MIVSRAEPLKSPLAPETGSAAAPLRASVYRPAHAASPEVAAATERAECAVAALDAADTAKVAVRGLDFFYGKQQVLFGNDLEVAANRITAIIGPSGCGKSTHLRTYNRIYELYRHQRAAGEIVLDGRNVLDPAVDVMDLRRHIGMIFQKPSPLPMSIFDNIAYGLRLHYRLGRGELHDRVEQALRQAALFDEVKDQLRQPGTALSGGQQQRLCIARAVALEPQVLLMDEPCSALDPHSTARIEELMLELAGSLSIVIVTHNMQQAARVSDYTAFMYLGRIVEFGRTADIFTKPRLKQTEDYVTGRFG